MKRVLSPEPGSSLLPRLPVEHHLCESPLCVHDPWFG